MTGDIRPALDPAVFADDAVAPETAAFNAALRSRMAQAPKWWELGAEYARTHSQVPSGPKSRCARTLRADAGNGRTVMARVIAPDVPKGVYLHFHGGGLVLGSADAQDPMLERIMRSIGFACVSVEYRLAPEHPYPAAWDDAETAAVWLARHAEDEFGTGILTIGGESAGATLAAATLLRLRDRHSFTGFRAANLSFGNYDMSMTPSQTLLGRDAYPICTDAIEFCTNSFAPDRHQRRNPDVSSLYADLRNLPRALFTVGTLDPFLDDTLFMHARWVAADNQAELAVYPGGTHGFTGFPLSIARQANERIDAFLRSAAEELGDKSCHSEWLKETEARAEPR